MDNLPKPQSRVEEFLEAVITKDINNLPEPQSRIEFFLYALVTGDISDLPKPQSRVEEFLEYIVKNESIKGDENVTPSKNVLKADNGNNYEIIIDNKGVVDTVRTKKMGIKYGIESNNYILTISNDGVLNTIRKEEIDA